MKYKITTGILRQNDNSIMQNSIPEKMFIAFIVSCILGIVLMAAISRYLLMPRYLRPRCSLTRYIRGKIGHTAVLFRCSGFG
jgi:hypothetical protein